MHCKKCGKTLTEGNRYGKTDICNSCYSYYKNGGTDNIPPKPGTINAKTTEAVYSKIMRDHAYKIR